MFFKKKNIHFKKLFPSLNLKKDFLVNDVKPLGLASKKEITFFDSINYKKNAITTKASACITTQKLEKFLPKNVNKIIVKNVLFELARIIKIFYPFSDTQTGTLP